MDKNGQESILEKVQYQKSNFIISGKYKSSLLENKLMAISLSKLQYEFLYWFRDEQPDVKGRNRWTGKSVAGETADHQWPNMISDGKTWKIYIYD